MMTEEQKAETLKEKITVYQKALDEVTAQLALLRTEKATEAKKTVSDYEPLIPELESRISSQRAELARLDKAISTRNELLASKKDTLEAEYQALKESLNSEWLAERKRLSEDRDAFSQQQAEFTHQKETVEASLKQREEAVIQLKAIHDYNVKEYEVLKEALTKERAGIVEVSERAMADIANMKVSVEAKLEAARSEHAAAERVTAALIEREKRAAAVLNRIAEVATRERTVKIDEDENIRRTEELNELSVELKAEKSRMSRRDDEQNTREAKLNKREANLKELEAKAA